MSDLDRALALSAGLVAAFVLALLLGRLAAPHIGDDRAPRSPEPTHAPAGHSRT